MPALARLGIPMLVFGVVFCASMVALQVLISPDRFPIRTGEKTVRLRDLSDERQMLLAKQQQLLQDRADLESKTPTPVIEQIEAVMRAQPDIGAALGQIDLARQGFVLGASDPVKIVSTSVRADGTIILTGQTEDAGDRSMQVLAAFIDALRKSGGFAGVSEPEYMQTPQEGGGTISPFQISLTIIHGT